MSGTQDVPSETVARLRSLCLGLPEAYEERAWTGTRRRIAKRTFAHVLMVDAGWPPAYARAAESDGPIIVLTFESSGPELDALGNTGHPFFKPRWRPDIIGMVLAPTSDWDEVAELITESYCVLAPSSLVESVDRPTSCAATRRGPNAPPHPLSVSRDQPRRPSRRAGSAP